jgi:ATP-dependent Clp protease, protease subunit
MIHIYGDLGSDVEVKDILEQIKNESSEEIELMISSVGGDAFGGLSIYDALKATGKKVKVNIFGICASASSIIAMAGDEIFMGAGAIMMIHCASASGGNIKELESKIELLKMIDDKMLNIYQSKTKLEKDFIKSLMEKETFMSSADALKYGFISSIDEKNEMVAKLKTINKKENETMLDENKKEETVTASFMAKVLESLGLKAKAAMPMDEVKEPSEAEKLKLEIEQKIKDIETMSEKLKELEGEKVEIEKEVEAKQDLIISALQDNKITIAKAKDFFAKSSAEISASLKELSTNASGFGSTGTPKAQPIDSPEAIYALYQSATGAEKTAIFNKHKQVILAQASKK